MKQLSIYLLLSISFFVLHCSDSDSGITENEKSMYRTAAYNYLSDGDKETVVSDWQEAPVERATFSQNNSGGPGIIREGSTTIINYITPISSLLPEGTPLVTVTFNTTDNTLLGPLVIILKEDATPIGCLPRL